MNRRPSSSPVATIGNALAFGLVVIIIFTGGYAVYGILWQGWDLFSLGGSEEVRPTQVVLVRPPTLTPIAGVVLRLSSPTALFQQPTPAPPTATSVPQITASPLPPTASPTATSPPPPPATVTLPPPPPPPPTATFLPTATAPPTPLPPTPTPSYLFIVSAAGPSFDRGCTGSYIFGFVRDASGAPLPGWRVRVWNQFGLALPAVTTRLDPAGWYEVPISPERALWYVQVVDAANSPLSPPIEVLHAGTFIEGVEACWHQVDFLRVQ